MNIAMRRKCPRHAVLLLVALGLVGCAQAGGPGADDDDDDDTSLEPDAETPVPEEIDAAVDAIDAATQPDAGEVDAALPPPPPIDAGVDAGVDASPPPPPPIDAAVPMPDAPLGENCTNGVDDDSDGGKDCADTDCAAAPGCELGGEVSCADGFDNDGDGAVDCAEAACALVCAVPACAAGERALGGRAGDLPKSIPDVGNVTSAITIARAGTVTRAAVRFSAMHPYAGDIELTLRSPASTSVNLGDDNGSTGDNFVATIFIDSATTAITAGGSPFTGQYRPEVPLSGVNGQAALGAWTLQVGDDELVDIGTFTQYELALCVAP